VENLPDTPASLSGERIPRDDGFGTPGNGQFNTPPLVEAADTPPFFHNNAAQTVEGAVGFYNSVAFNQSPAGRLLASLDAKGVGIDLDSGQVEAVAAFLRVINALENIREGDALLRATSGSGYFAYALNRENLAQAAKEIGDAERALSQAGLHPQAAARLRESSRLAQWAGYLGLFGEPLVQRALAQLDAARAELIGGTTLVTALEQGRQP